MKSISRLSFILSVVFIPGLLNLLPADPVNAQSYRRRDYQSASYYCDGLARDQANRRSSGSTLRGAGRGAAGGALFGAIAGDAGAGAAIGAGVGAIGGSIRKAESSDSIYRSEYDDCMRRQGY